MNKSEPTREWHPIMQTNHYYFNSSWCRAGTSQREEGIVSWMVWKCESWTVYVEANKRERHWVKRRELFVNLNPCNADMERESQLLLNMVCDCWFFLSLNPDPQSTPFYPSISPLCPIHSSPYASLSHAFPSVPASSPICAPFHLTLVYLSPSPPRSSRFIPFSISLTQYSSLNINENISTVFIESESAWNKVAIKAHAQCQLIDFKERKNTWEAFLITIEKLQKVSAE